MKSFFTSGLKNLDPEKIQLGIRRLSRVMDRRPVQALPKDGSLLVKRIWKQKLSCLAFPAMSREFRLVCC